MQKEKPIPHEFILGKSGGYLHFKIVVALGGV